MAARNESIIVLFDVDGTLTPSRKSISPDMKNLLLKLREKVVVGIVGGSDMAKQREQLGVDVLEWVDYSFSENGLIAYEGQKQIHERSILVELGNDKLKNIVNFALHYIADLDIPVKRGTFVEYRTGMLNLCPIGRNCSQKERDEFYAYDQEHKIRETFAKVLREKFADYELTFAIGGQISLDVFPKGWDKTYCLRHLEGKNFKEIHFFGDKTEPGGNDHEIFADPRTKGHTVNNPEDCAQQLQELFAI